MRGVIYTIIAVLLCALQTTLFEVLKIFNIRPNLMLAFVVCVALLRGSVEGGAVGLLCGILSDVMGYGRFGVNSLMFLYLGTLIGLFSGRFYRVRSIVAFAFTFVSSFTYGFLYYFFAFYVWGKGSMWFALSKKIFPECLYTSFVSILILLFLIFLDKRFKAREA